jgi:hypothetical protein
MTGHTLPSRVHTRLGDAPSSEAKRYVLTERVPIGAGVPMGRGWNRPDRARWHILDEHGNPLCGRLLSWEIVDLAPFADPQVKRVCNPCHGQFSWSADPRDYVEEDRGYVTACHIWTRALTKAGYATRVARGAGGKKLTMVHREAYEAARGEIPDGYDLHHLCEQPACIRVDHLVALTRSEHLRLHRGIA